MSIRSVGDLPRNEPGLVDKFLGTSYDVVKKVYDDLAVLNAIPSLAQEVAANKEDVDAKAAQVAEDATAVSTDRAAAEKAANSAEQSAMVAQIAGHLYANETDGLANTANGDYFVVAGPNGGEVFSTLYQNVNGSPNIINTYPSTSGAWDRANHTGTQSMDTVDGLEAALDKKANEDDLTTALSGIDSSISSLEENQTKIQGYIKSVKDNGAVGDGKTDDSEAFAKCITQGGKWFVPDGTYYLTNNAALLNSPNFYGPGILNYVGWIFPAGDVTSYINLPVPSVFPTIQDAVNWCQDRSYHGKDAFASIDIADGDYTLSDTIEPRFPSGKDHIQFVGNLSDPSKVNLTFDTTNNKCGFLFQKGSGCYLIDGMTLNGQGAFQSYGVWADQGYGAGIRAAYNSYACVGSNVRINHFYYGISARYSSTILCSSGVIVQYAGDVAFHAFGSSSIDCQGCQAFWTAHTEAGLGFGFMAEASSFVDASNSYSAHNLMAGYYANLRGSVWAHSSEANNNRIGFLAINGGAIEATKTGEAAHAYDNTEDGFSATDGGYINANSSLSENNGGNGYYAQGSSVIDITAANASNNAKNGFQAFDGGLLEGNSPNAYKNALNGFYSSMGSKISSGGNMQFNNNTGYGLLADFMSIIYITGTNWGGGSNGNDKSPSQSQVMENNGSYLFTPDSDASFGG